MTLFDTFPPNSRVEFGPHTDLWMRGCRYGTVKFASDHEQVVMVNPDKLRGLVKCKPEDITPLRPSGREQ